jgi:hypothetical protein
MNTQYEEYWHQAMELKHQTHDLINDHNHPIAHVLHQQTTGLVDDIELQRHPRDIDDRIQRIKTELIQARSQGDAVLNTEHSVLLHHSYEKMREGIRRLPHF